MDAARHLRSIQYKSPEIAGKYDCLLLDMMRGYVSCYSFCKPIERAKGLIACPTYKPASMAPTDEKFVCEICGDSFDSEEERKEHIFAAHEVEA